MKFKDPMVMKALLLQLEGKIIEEGDEDSSMGFRFDVSGYTVRIFNKPGRKLISCTCENHVRHCTQPTICSHKLAGILQWVKMTNEIISK